MLFQMHLDTWGGSDDYVFILPGCIREHSQVWDVSMVWQCHCKGEVYACSSGTHCQEAYGEEWTPVPPVNMSSLFSGKHSEYCLTYFIFSTPSMRSYPLADDIEYSNVNSTVLKTHLCLNYTSIKILNNTWGCRCCAIVQFVAVIGYSVCCFIYTFIIYLLFFYYYYYYGS